MQPAPLRPGLLPALAAFAAAARRQNFAHAAEELHLTASAVSHHVRRLEALLGVALFQRHARGVALTPEGRLLADAAGSALQDLESVLATLKGGGQESRVRITCLPSFASAWLIPRLPGFIAAHPGLRLSVDTDRALARFDGGGPDLGIRYGPGRWPGLDAQHLMDDTLFPVAAPTLPGVDGLQSPRDIARLPLIADLAMEGWREWFRAAGVRNPLRASEAHSFSDTHDALRAAAAGLGAALARRTLAAPLLEGGLLARLPGPELPTRFAYYVVQPEHRHPSPAAAAFVRWLQGEASRPQA
jgi:DNA-binding transcriptional LysR family regulator